MKKGSGGFTLKADETLKPGFNSMLIIKAVSKKGRVETCYPLSAIPIEVVAGSGGKRGGKVVKK